MEEVRFKSDSQCIQCLKNARKEIIKEIRENAGCNTCKNLYKVDKEDHHLVYKVHGKIKTATVKKL